MKPLSLGTAALILAVLATPAAAQLRGAGSGLGPRLSFSGLALHPRGSLHVLNPSMSLSAPATSPLSAQIQDDYATQLQQAQRDLLQRNPSGLGRQEVAISHELNGYVAPR